MGDPNIFLGVKKKKHIEIPKLPEIDDIPMISEDSINTPKKTLGDIQLQQNNNNNTLKNNIVNTIYTPPPPPPPLKNTPDKDMDMNENNISSSNNISENENLK